MLDIKLVRENPDMVRKNIKKRFQEEKLPLVDELLEKDEKYRSYLKKSQDLRAKRNILSQEINKVKKSGGDIKQLIREVKEIPGRIEKIEEKQSKLKTEVDQILYTLPSIIHKSVPIGKDYTKNKVIETVGKPAKKDVLGHVELAEKRGWADFDSSARISGTGFYFLKGDLALLNMALINFARDYMVTSGYEYVEPPLMIREDVLKGVFSKEEIDVMSYKIDGEDLFLVATSEHPLIGMFAGTVIDFERLPIKITGFSPCFRKEIGSHGIDEKGLFRTHQFYKQEMVVICKAGDSYKFYDEMNRQTKKIFKSLGLPFREVESCSGDLADLKAKSSDIEVWSPRKNDYIEVTSLTNMEEAQARRLNIRATDGKERFYVHTLNNTVIATSRAMVAILENNQMKDGMVKIPKVLVPYMGKDII